MVAGAAPSIPPSELGFGGKNGGEYRMGRCAGMSSEPVSRLYAKSSVFRKPHRDRSGMPPLNLLCLRRRCVRRTRPPSVCGIEPERPLLERSSFSSVGIAVAKLAGNMPWRLLPGSSMATTLSPMQCTPYRCFEMHQTNFSALLMAQCRKRLF